MSSSPMFRYPLSDLGVIYPENAKEFSNSNTFPQALSVLSSHSFCCVLEDAIEQLVILSCIGNLPKVEADLNNKSLEERFSNTRLKDLMFEPESLEPFEIFLEKEKFAKVQRDRSYIEKVLRETFTCLSTTDTYDALVGLIDQYNENILEEEDLLNTELENRNELQELSKSLVRERKDTILKLQTLSTRIGKLQDLMQDNIYECAIKKKYVDKWEDARYEQHDLNLTNKEGYFTNIIKTNEDNMEKEFCVHREIERFIAETQDEYSEQIQSWKDQYYEAIELYDTKINLVKMKRENQLITLQELTAEFEKREKEIADYLEVKEQRRLAAEALARLHRAATKIQAWWRGTMVRKCLGPYKVDPKKAKKGKDVKETGKKGKK